MKTILAALLALTAASATAADPEIWRFYGYAYDLETNKYLYTEVHEQHVDTERDRWIKGSIDYFLPSGEHFGHKSLDFANDETVPMYRMEQFDIGRVEAITDNRDPIQMLIKVNKDKPEKTGSMPKKGALAADSGFHMFIRTHFDEILQGKTVKFAFVAAPELDHFRFEMYRMDDATFEGKPAVQIKVKPASVLSWIVDPLVLLYDEKSKRLLEFRGISNIHNPKTGKAYNVRISYFAQPPQDAPKPLPPLGGPERRE